MQQTITKKEAIEEGYTVDTSCYPWVAYKGPRFQPTEMQWCYTDLEASLMESNPAVAAIDFALTLRYSETHLFLNYWLSGWFEILRREWPEAPEEVYINADPLHPKTVI